MLKLRPPSRYQDPDELRRFVEFVVGRDVRRYLEIGSRWGDSFFAIMANLRPGAFGVCVDLPESDGKKASVLKTIEEITKMGQDARAIFGSSRDASVQLAVAGYAPFDLVFIDGDHTHEGVAADWADYHTLAPVIALHDIAAPDDWRSDGKPNGVGRFWRELKESKTVLYGSHLSTTGYRVEMQNHDGVVADAFREVIEFVTPGANMGYGIIVR